MVSLIYNLFFVIPAKILIPFVSLFNKKLRKREKDWKKILDNTLIDTTRKKIWFHSASMGEFEQAKSVIEAIKQQNPDIFIITSFYSPSGFENQRNYKYSDAMVYLPFDTKHSIKLFLDKIQPDCCVFIRYDLWLNLLSELHRRNFPVLLINATKPSKLNPDFFLFKSFLKKLYSLVDEITTVGEVHTNFFKALLPEKNIQTLTDTRFDRIINQIELSRKEPVLNKDIFKSNQLVLIAGSTWEPDETLIWQAYNKIAPDLRSKLRLIFVPHEPTTEHLKKLNNLCGNLILLSKLIENHEIMHKNAPETPIIVDSIGKLLRLYGIADFAYVGGGFGVGIHSVTEPAGYGIPIVTGPKINNSPDAINLMNFGSLFPIKNSREFENWLYLMINNEEIRLKAGEISRDYIFRNSGSTTIVVKKILDLI